MKKIILLMLISTKVLSGELMVYPVTDSNPYFGGKNLNITATDHRGKVIKSCEKCNRLIFTAKGPASQRGRVTITGAAQGNRNFSMQSSGLLHINVTE